LGGSVRDGDARLASGVTDQQRTAVRDRCDGAAPDDFELPGEQALVALLDAVERMPAHGARPELTRARAALEFTSSGRTDE
jgi:hypothetical protein